MKREVISVRDEGNDTYVVRYRIEGFSNAFSLSGDFYHTLSATNELDAALQVMNDRELSLMEKDRINPFTKATGEVS